MLALVGIITVVAMLAIARLVGREEALRAMQKHLTHLRAELPAEDKLLFDKWIRDYNNKYYRKEEQK